MASATAPRIPLCAHSGFPILSIFDASTHDYTHARLVSSPCYPRPYLHDLFMPAPYFPPLCPVSSTPLLRRPFVLRLAHASRASFQYNYRHAARAPALRALLLLIPIPLSLPLNPLFLSRLTKIQRWPRTLGLYQNSSVLSLIVCSFEECPVCLLLSRADYYIPGLGCSSFSLSASPSRFPRRICISGISHVCTPSGLIRVFC